MLAPLAERYGAATVWQVGIETLGYPPSWLIGPKALTRIAEALERSDLHGDG